MLAALVTVLGLWCGSLANVCIRRMPRHEPLFAPLTGCGECGRPARLADRIPVASYFIQHGKCPQCGARMSLRDPAIELLTGLLFLTAYLSLGPSWLAAAAMLTIVVATIAFACDMDTRLIPNALTGPAILAGLLIALASGRLVSSLLGLAICGGAFLVIGLIGAGKMGGGDVKLAAAIGAILGSGAGVVAVFLGVLGGALIGLAMLALRRATLKSYIPFAPPLAVAAVAVAVFWSHLGPALRAYFGW